VVEQATGLTRLAGFAGKPQHKVVRLMRQLYDSEHRRIIFLGEKATPEFWDGRWQVQNLRQFILSRKNPWLVGITRRYLSRGARVLEGGCGRGDKVHALRMNGFVALGMDYAEHTVKAINRCMPELKPVLDGSGFWWSALPLRTFTAETRGQTDDA
jgi:hypothetical protein